MTAATPNSGHATSGEGRTDRPGTGDKPGTAGDPGTAGNPGTAGDPGTQSIEELEERYQRLSRRKVRAETNRENAEKQLNELKREATERYGTDDIDELRRKLAEMKQENERKKAEYQKHLDGVEAELADVEARFAEDG
jgi:hypothetical protein